MLKLHRVDSKKFLLFIFAIYFMVFIFSYAFFTINDVVITGYAAMGISPEDPIKLNNIAMEKATTSILIIFVIVTLIWIVSWLYLKQSKNKNSLKNNRIYRALNIKNQ